jgi:hypothetical protein
MTLLVKKHCFPLYHASSILSFVDETAETWDLEDIVVWHSVGATGVHWVGFNENLTAMIFRSRGPMLLSHKRQFLHLAPL